ncbi:hypothetical protein [Catenulispora rubra]|uniref:hypothetical protein n=1 Tax=Catenulispora rubra TaxID=280293 RepID=UPI0018925110|nr:hypothetical protein [Catenulispora rubra]
MILLQLAWMAEQLLEWAPTVWGAALIPEIEAIGRLMVSQIAKRFVTSVASATAIQTGMDSAVQAFQMFVLKDRDHWDTSSTLSAAEMGVLSGGIGAAFHEVGHGIAPDFVNSFKGKVTTATATGLTSAMVSNAVFGGNQDLGLALSSGLLGGVLGAKGPHGPAREALALDLGSLHELGELAKKIDGKEGLPGFETTFMSSPKLVDHEAQGVPQQRPAVEGAEPPGGPGSGGLEEETRTHQLLSSGGGDQHGADGPAPVAEHSPTVVAETPTSVVSIAEHPQATAPDARPTVAAAVNEHSQPISPDARPTVDLSQPIAQDMRPSPGTSAAEQPQHMVRGASVAERFPTPVGDTHDWSVARPIEVFTDEAHASSFLSNFGVGYGRTLHLRDAVDPTSVPQHWSIWPARPAGPGYSWSWTRRAGSPGKCAPRSPRSVRTTGRRTPPR